MKGPSEITALPGFGDENVGKHLSSKGLGGLLGGMVIMLRAMKDLIWRKIWPVFCLNTQCPCS